MPLRARDFDDARDDDSDEEEEIRVFSARVFVFRDVYVESNNFGERRRKRKTPRATPPPDTSRRLGRALDIIIIVGKIIVVDVARVVVLDRQESRRARLRYRGRDCDRRERRRRRRKRKWRRFAGASDDKGGIERGQSPVL